MKYKINIHSHTFFSDGSNSPYVMALKAKELGFTSLVITDHFYGHNVPNFISKNSMRLLKKACAEAREILPVIIGLEVPLFDQEILVFGGEAINKIIAHGLPNLIDIKLLHDNTYCAIILCHPGDYSEFPVDLVDGFEHYNGGTSLFKDREFGSLEGKSRWSNSDAHMAKYLDTGYNITDTKIEYEQDLIRYILKGKQPELYIKEQE